jgi:Fur family ferric uptake transcriptional regulator
MHSRHPSDSERKPGRNRQLQEAIEAIVKDIPRGVHLTAPEVFRRAREQGLQVSLSTVYRTLNLLQAHGNVSTVAGEHGRRYEARDEDHDHDHLICLKCGLTIEFTDELIRGFGRAVAQRKGYEHASSRFDILGICSTCKAQDEDHKINTSIASLKNVADYLSSTAEKVAGAIALLEARKINRAAEIISEISESLMHAQVESEQSADVLTSPPKEII